jgi:hypothetical protein
MKFTFRTVILTAIALTFFLAPTDQANAQKKDKKSVIPEIKGLFKVEGCLTRHDLKDRSLNTGCNIYTFKLIAGQTYQIDQVTPEFDSYLRLEDDNGKELARDDDGGGYPNARIVFVCPATGTYHIIATALGNVSFKGTGYGKYTLTIQKK